MASVSVALPGTQGIDLVPAPLETQDVHSAGRTSAPNSQCLFPAVRSHRRLGHLGCRRASNGLAGATGANTPRKRGAPRFREFLAYQRGPGGPRLASKRRDDRKRDWLCVGIGSSPSAAVPASNDKQTLGKGPWSSGLQAFEWRMQLGRDANGHLLDLARDNNMRLRQSLTRATFAIVVSSSITTHSWLQSNQ